MSAIDSVTLEVEDVAAAEEFYSALGVGDSVRVSAADAPSDGFRSYTLSLVTSQPGNADLFFHAAIAAGATELKPLNKSIWGYGGVFRAPAGAIWKVASSKKKDSRTPAQSFDELVLTAWSALASRSSHFQGCGTPLDMTRENQLSAQCKCAKCVAPMCAPEGKQVPRVASAASGLTGVAKCFDATGGHGRTQDGVSARTSKIHVRSSEAIAATWRWRSSPRVGLRAAIHVMRPSRCARKSGNPWRFWLAGL